MTRLPGTLLLLALLALLAAPAGAAAAELGSGTGDEEHHDDEAAAPATPAPAPERPAAPPEATRPAERPTPPPATARDYVPATHSVSLDLGGAVNMLGGWAYPKIRLERNTPDHGFYAHGLGAGAKLHWDFPAQDLDWRIGVDGTLPGYAALEATVGVRKNVSPWRNPQLLIRAGGGLEFMLGASEDEDDESFLIPVFVGKGEVALEITLVENVLRMGPVVEIGVKYGLPLGVGFDFGGFLRTEVSF